MSLFIKIDENGQPVGHPIHISNYHGLLNTHGLHHPEMSYSPFIRKLPSEEIKQELINRKKNENEWLRLDCKYEHDGNIWCDNWYIVEMTPEEIEKRKEERIEYEKLHGPMKWI